MENNNNNNVKNMALCGMLVAVISICSMITLRLPLSPVPVTMQTFAVFLTGMVLDRKLGALTMIVYILLGVAGLPIFSGFGSGPGWLLGPTGGYLMGFVPGAYMVGLVRDTAIKVLPGKTGVAVVLGAVAGIAVVYILGTLQYAFLAGISFWAAFSIAVLPFIPPDALKIMLAVVVYKQLHRALFRIA